MEFKFNINHLIGETITKLDNNVTPSRRNADGYDIHTLRSQLMTVIDRMGDASSKAQGLHNIITTGRKLQLSDHILYIMKDDNGPRGSVVGILKIGYKKLFVYDNHGAVHELDPLCVLDFYVHESRQRMGCGRQLFDYMLQDQGMSAPHLAIDKPSFKFSQFLYKHYHLRAEIPQVNNFVVFEGFFKNRGDSAKRKINGRPPQPPKKRDQVPDDGVRRQNTYNSYGLPLMSPQQTGQIGSAGRMGSRPGSGTSVRSAKAPSPSLHASPRGQQQDYLRNGQLRPISGAKREEPTDQRVVSAQAHKTTGQQIYSRHVAGSPVGSLPGSRPTSNTRVAGTRTPQNVPTSYPEPPPLKRGMTTDNYVQNFNLHQDYLGRGGHLKTGQPPFKPVVRNPFLTREEEMAAGTNHWAPPKEDKSWTVFNKPPGYLTIAQRNYTHTRLW